MDWLKHFVIEKLDDCVETNGLKQGLVCHEDRLCLYLATDDMIDGICCTDWKENGNIERIMYFIKDQKNGYQYKYWRNGKMNAIMYYMNNLRHGLHIFLNSTNNHEIQWIDKYDNGKHISTYDSMSKYEK